MPQTRRTMLVDPLVDNNPITLPSSTTGRCRTRRSVIASMQAFTVWSLAAVITEVVMISATVVSLDERPLIMTLRA